MRGERTRQLQRSRRQSSNLSGIVETTHCFAVHRTPQRTRVQWLRGIEVVETDGKAPAAGHAQHPLDRLWPRFHPLELILPGTGATVRVIPVAVIELLPARSAGDAPVRDLMQRALEIIVTENDLVPVAGQYRRPVQRLLAARQQAGAMARREFVRKDVDQVIEIAIHEYRPGRMRRSFAAARTLS